MLRTTIARDTSGAGQIAKLSPAIRGGLAMRATVLAFGLVLFAFGIVLLLEAELGLMPWDVLNQGISNHTPLSFGGANVVVALCLLTVARACGARIGPGTVANAVLIGLFVDLFVSIGMADGLSQAPVVIRAASMIAAVLTIGIGSALYIGAGMGAGPRDSLMIVTAARSGLPIGTVRAGIEIAATAAGLALGGTVGVATLAFALGIGVAVQSSFRLLAWSPLTASRPRHRHDASATLLGVTPRSGGTEAGQD